MRVVMLLLIFIYGVSSSVYGQPNTKANEPKRSVAVKKTDITALPAKAKRFALIVGIDSYQSNQLTKLGGAVNDAKALAETLEVYAGFPKEQIYLLTSPTVKIGEKASSTSEANRSNILRTLAIIGQSIPKDGLLLVAFACHGMQRDKKSDKVYILPSDAETLTTDLLEDTALNVEKLKERILVTEVGQVIFLVDACRNDPEVGRGEADNLLTKDYLKAFSFNFDKKNEGVGVGAFATFFAASEGERAYEDGEKKQGYFTYAFIEGLKGAAANREGEVTLINLKGYLERVVPTRVKSNTGGKQIPKIIIGGYQSENLVLSVVSKANTPKPKMEVESEVPLGTLIVTVSRRDMEILVDKEVVAKSKAIGEKITIRNVEAGRPVEVTGRVKGEKNIVETVELISGAKTEISLGKIVIENSANGTNNTILDNTSNNTPKLPAYKPIGTAVAPSMRSYSYETVELDGNGNIKSRPRGQASYYEEDLGGGIKLEMVEVAGGEFVMGSSKSEVDKVVKNLEKNGISKEYAISYTRDEGPEHEVRVPAFYMGKYEVTQGQWKAIMGSNPSSFTGDENLPVERVSWEDAVEFCKKLSEKTGREYRLPSEAEWEYAARGGTTTAFGYGETVNPNIVNYNGNYPYGGAAKGEYRRKTVKVGTFPPNAFGLYEMHGNVWEWCQDIYQSDYKGAPIDGRAWEKQGADNKYRVLRGGSWGSNAYVCRSAYRRGDAPDGRSIDIGFRVVASARTLK